MVNRLLVILGHMFTMAHGLDIEGVPHRTTLGIRLLKVRQTHERHLSPEEAKRLNHALRHSSNPMLRYIVAYCSSPGHASARRSTPAGPTSTSRPAHGSSP
jgi:SpoVK/Ycf46/Vps4 family AAA+-type ATPase